MKFAITLLATVLLSPPAAAESRFAGDERAIRAVIADYFWGRQNGDQARLGRAMALDGGDLKGVGTSNGREAMTVTPLADYVARNARPRSVPTEGEILALDITDGRMAWAKIKLVSSREAVTDYLLLYRIGADWKIVSKMFVRSPLQDEAPRP